MHYTLLTWPYYAFTPSCCSLLVLLLLLALLLLLLMLWKVATYSWQLGPELGPAGKGANCRFLHHRFGNVSCLLPLTFRGGLLCLTVTHPAMQKNCNGMSNKFGYSQGYEFCS